MTEEVETEKVIQPSQNDNTDREQPQEKQSVGNTTEAKDNPQTIAPIPYPQRLKKHKLDKQFTKFMEVFKNCTSIFRLLMLWNRCQAMPNL